MANEAIQSGLDGQSGQTIVLGGRCFWRTEAVFDRMLGITDVESGYSQGHVDQPSYEQVSSGSTGRNEVVKLTFDPASVSLRQILEVFFVVHDSTTPNRQCNDVGTQYRSGIYYQNDEHKQIAQEVIDELTKAKAFGRPIVTELEALANYSTAGAYHQDYFTNHPNQGYCTMVAAPKVEKFRRTFKRLVHA
ncbi:MAG: peptide-methionine (S)-S-oxide reductase MsrA [Burkholderiaceae bacterium]